MLFLPFLLITFSITKAIELEEDHYRDGFVDKKFENGNDWTTFCKLNGPTIGKMNYTQCSINLFQYESVRIKCPRILHTGYDFFPTDIAQVYTKSGVDELSKFKSVPLASIDKELFATNNNDEYNLFLNYKGRTDKTKTIYYICGTRAFGIDTALDQGYITSLIEIVLLPLDSDEIRKYNIKLSDNPLSTHNQTVKLFREIDYHGIYTIDCGSARINVKNTFEMPIESSSRFTLSGMTKYGDSSHLLQTSDEEGGMYQFPKGVKVKFHGKDAVKKIKTAPEDLMTFFCSEYGSDFDDHLTSVSLEDAHKALDSNPPNPRLSFTLPVNHQFPICSSELNKYEQKDKFVCKHDASTKSYVTLHCPKNTHTFDMEKCINSFNSWQDYRIKKLINKKDFNIIPIFQEFYLFLIKNITSGFLDQIDCSCDLKAQSPDKKPIQLLIQPRLVCDFNDVDKYHAAIDNNICTRVIRPGESLLVVCKKGDVIYPKKNLAYVPKTTLPFTDIVYKGVKKSDLQITPEGNDKFVISLDQSTNAFLGQKYAFGCSNGRGIRETGFPAKDGGVVVVTTGNVDFPDPIDNKVQTLVSKLKQSEYGYYNLKLTYGELLLECKNYLNDTDDKTSVLYPINWNEFYSEQPKKGVDPRTMSLTHPNEYMGFHGITFKKLPEKQKLPSSLSISIKDDAIFLSRNQTPLYFICTDQNDDTVWDEKKGRFTVFEIEFDLNYREMVGCGVYPQIFKDSKGNVMTKKNCNFNIKLHDKVGFHCPLSNDSPKPPECYDRSKGKKTGKVDIFNRPDELHEARSLWVFTKEHLKNTPQGVECLCISKGATIATIVITSASTYLTYSLTLFIISIIF